NRRRALLGERTQELAVEARGKFAIVDTIAIGQFASRHVECAEKDVEDREGRGEVLLASAVRRRMMPAVKHGSGDHVFERAERPVKIRVHKGGMCDGDRTEHDEDVGGY